MAESLSQMLANRAKKADEVQARLVAFNHAFEELAEIDMALNPRLEQLNNALYALTGSSITTGAEYIAPPKPEAQLVIGKSTVFLRRPSKREELEHVVVDILRKAGRPMATLELFNKVASTGFDVGGKKPRSNLGAHLSHSSVVIKKDNLWHVA